METETYKATTTTETATSSEGPGIGLDRAFPKTPMGILLIAASVSGLIFSICGSVYPWSYHGGGFGAFVGWAAFLGTGILFALYLFRVLPRIPGPFGLVILVFVAVVTVLGLIAFILSAVNAGSFNAAVAGAIFGAICVGLHGAVGFLMFRKWQQLKNNFHRGECGHSYSIAQHTYTTTEEMGPPPAYGNY